MEGYKLNKTKKLNDFAVESKKKCLKWMNGNEAAVAFIQCFFGISQLADDFADGDMPLEDAQPQMARLLYWCLFQLPTNSFYVEYEPTLRPVMYQILNQWVLSNQLAASNDEVAEQWAYVIRDSTFSIIGTCALICGGPEHATVVTKEAYDHYFLGKDREAFEEWRNGT